MQFQFPKNDVRYYWTNHVKRKMVFYGISSSRIKIILRNPKRSEKGIALNTIAVMQPRKTTSRLQSKPTRHEEIWVMYQKQSQKLGRKIIITAWRYPGVSPVREQIPIPHDIIEELKREGVIK